jgi:hypothetical protein
MNLKLKLTYILFVVFSSISLVSFQNCTQQGTTDFGDFSSGSGNNNGANCTNFTKSPALNALLLDPNFKYVITDNCGEVIYTGAGGPPQDAPVILSASGRYRFYVVGIDNIPTTTPNRWLACAMVAGANDDFNNNMCTHRIPSTVLTTSAADCTLDPDASQTGEPGEKSYRVLNCDPNWKIVTEFGRPVIVNYDWFRNNGQQWIPANLTIYTYIKANNPSDNTAIRLILRTQ